MFLFPEAAKEGNDRNSPTHDPYFMDDVKQETGMAWEDIPEHLWANGNKNFVGG